MLAIIFGIFGLGNSRTMINALGLPVERTPSIAGIALGAIGAVGSFAIGSLWQFLSQLTAARLNPRLLPPLRRRCTPLRRYGVVAPRAGVGGVGLADAIDPPFRHAGAAVDGWFAAGAV